MKGLYIPLVTPFYKGKFDSASLVKLMKTVEPHVDGFVPCLSSGEGQKITNDVWEQVVKIVKKQTKKPVYPGIKRKNIKEVVTLMKKAKDWGCAGVVIPVPSADEKESLNFFTFLNKKIDLPIVIYNTETNKIKSKAVFEKVFALKNIIGIKDSSCSEKVFQNLLSLKKNTKKNVFILQGMENQLLSSKGCDGYLISLLNLEPALCKMMFQKQDKKTNDKILQLFSEYNLGRTWFITLKALLFARGILRSAEEAP